MDEKTLTCEACGGKTFKSPEEKDTHDKEAHAEMAGHDHDEGSDHDTHQ